MFFKFFMKTYLNKEGKIKKKHLKKAAKVIAPIVSIVNPIAGAALGAVSGGSEGLKQSLKTSLISNVIMGNKVFNLSASGKVPQATTLITETIKQPEKILLNTITSGGNLEQGLLKTVMQTGNVPKELQMAISQDFGGIMLADMLTGKQGSSLADPMMMAMLYEAYKSKPPAPPTLPELEKIGDEEVYKRLDMFRTELDEATQQRLDMAQARFSSRGIRGGVVDEEIRLIYKDRDFQMQKAEMDLREQQLRYNNALETERYAAEISNYQLQAQAQKEKMDALTNTIALMQTRSQNMTEDIVGSFRNIITGMGESLGLIKQVGDQKFWSDEATGQLIDIDSGIFNMGEQYGGDRWKNLFSTEQKTDFGMSLDIDNRIGIGG